MKTLKLASKSVAGLLMLMLLVGLWVAPAAAQTGTGTGTGTGQRNFTGLKYDLKRTVLQAKALQSRIDIASEAGDLVEEYIADEKAAGSDTSALETALSTFRTKVAQAQTLHDTAAQTLETKAGFDADDNVTDAQQARTTLETAHRAIQDANQTLRPAGQDLRQALRDYRQNKRGNK